MLNELKEMSNLAFTENGARTHRSTMDDCLDFFATAGALRNLAASEIVSRFQRAYAQDRDLALKTLFFARDIRGGLGERRVFRIILEYLSTCEAETVRKNLPYVAYFGRYDDLLCLIGTPCEKDAVALIKSTLENDIAECEKGHSVSLLAKWLPSANASSRETVKLAKRLLKLLGMSEKEYRQTLSKLRERISIVENDLRLKYIHSFAYEKLPSKALFKYRDAFRRRDQEGYDGFLHSVSQGKATMHTATMTPYDIVHACINEIIISEGKRKALDVTWNALENHATAKNTLVVVDGSASMYWSPKQLPAAVAQSLAIYFAERCEGQFKNHFITFSTNPRLVEIKGRDIYEKVRYCMKYNEIANTNIEKVFKLILRTAVENNLPKEDLPSTICIISDMEFDCCTLGAGKTNFENAKAMFEEHGYELPTIVFWNVDSRNQQMPVTMNEQGVILVSGSSARVFDMLNTDNLSPYGYMLEVLGNERYDCISA